MYNMKKFFINIVYNSTYTRFLLSSKYLLYMGHDSIKKLFTLQTTLHNAYQTLLLYL